MPLLASHIVLCTSEQASGVLCPVTGFVPTTIGCVVVSAMVAVLSQMMKGYDVKRILHKVCLKVCVFIKYYKDNS